MIVADTNLVAYLLVEGERTGAAEAVWEADPDWVMPALWRSELLNVLVTSTRAGVLTGEEARRAWQTARLLFDGADREVDGEAVLDAALRGGLSAYDAQFVVLADTLDVPLVTGDRRILGARPDRARRIEDFGG